MKIKFFPISLIILFAFLSFKVFKIYNSNKEESKIAELTSQIKFTKPLQQENNVKKAEPKEKENDVAEQGTGLEEADFYRNKPKQVNSLETHCYEVDKDILLHLQKRREELAEWTKEAKIKESILLATEQKLNQKLEELKSLKEQVSALIELYNKKEDAKLTRLVKIYESMKPKAAALIFEKLDMKVLLDVLDKMKEAKVAPILANVDPIKAEEITQQFSERRKLQDPRCFTPIQ